MKLSSLISELRAITVSGPQDQEITGVVHDSRRVQPGSLFCALAGGKTDGAKFIEEAVEKGAVAILAASTPTTTGVCWLQTANPRRAMAEAAAIFAGRPSAALKVAGVTGTNGKTTIGFLVHHLIQASRHRAGLLGTVTYNDGIESHTATHTTPESPDLQDLLARMVAHQCYGVAMEVSSHALVQDRTHGIEFDAGIFTNLTQDHLDFHQGMEEYFKAKELLFEHLASQGGAKKPVAIINNDDPYGRRLATRFEGRLKVVRYGLGTACDFKAGGIKFDFNGTSFQLEAGQRQHLVRTPLIGRFNVYNSLAALAAAVACGLNLREAVANLAQCPQVPGRLESIAGKRNFKVFVDYAHTPDALENAINTLRELNPKRLITVFGCGGDRDRDKRPRMGAIADQLSDYTILTSDNPRSESPVAIIEDIQRGFKSDRCEAIVDRKNAISRAIEAAREGDIILIAGKGHEDYQIFADRTIEFDDRAVARRCLADHVSQ